MPKTKMPLRVSGTCDSKTERDLKKEKKDKIKRKQNKNLK